MTAPLLEINDLRVEIGAGPRAIAAVTGLSFAVAQGETLVVLGESGSGKSVSLLAATRLLPVGRTSGTVRFRGEDVLAMPLRRWRRIAGREIGMVFQDALAALNPVFSVGWQVAERLRLNGTGRRAAWVEAARLLVQVGIPDAAHRLNDYPHQFSGGMRQRIVIAIALATRPALMICDEPTTALDATIQAQILDLLARLRDETGTAMIMVTHDLAVAAETADRIVVMYGGRIVEAGTRSEVLGAPRHPYTAALIAAAPRVDHHGAPLDAIPGVAPDLSHLPPGCPFAPRCRRRSTACEADPPPVLQSVAQGAGHTVACHHPLEALYCHG